MFFNVDVKERQNIKEIYKCGINKIAPYPNPTLTLTQRGFVGAQSSGAQFFGHAQMWISAKSFWLNIFCVQFLEFLMEEIH